MTTDFTQLYTYNPSTNSLQTLNLASGNMTWQNYPVVAATADENYAVAVIAPSNQNGITTSYSSGAPATGTCTGLNVSMSYGSLPAGNLVTSTFMIVGSLSDITAKLPLAYSWVH